MILYTRSFLPGGKNLDIAFFNYCDNNFFRIFLLFPICVAESSAGSGGELPACQCPIYAVLGSCRTVCGRIKTDPKAEPSLPERLCRDLISCTGLLRGADEGVRKRKAPEK